MSPKTYDRAYFDRWYRGRGSAVGAKGPLRRKVAVAVAMAEFVLDRRIDSVLDIGCGEGRWQPVLFEMRPEATYLGIDSSEHAVETYGASRNIRHGTFEELAYHVFEDTFDLVVCSDVLHYLSKAQIQAGLPSLVDLTGGVAFLEVFTRSDDPEGDMIDFRKRPPASYRSLFAAAGLVPIGMQFYVPDDDVSLLDAMELPG